MQPESFTLAGRVVGGPEGDRKIVDRAAAIAAYRGATTRTDEVAFITHFSFDESIRQYMRGNGRSMRGFSGATWADSLVLDVDNEDDLGAALDDTWRIVRHLTDHLLVPAAALEISFSGGKGFHTAVPTWAIGSPPPSLEFHEAARSFCMAIAAASEVTIDSGVFDRVRLMRAPNSRHRKTGWYKRHLPIDQFHICGIGDITRLAASPEPYDVAPPGEAVPALVEAWSTAVADAAAARVRRAEHAARRARDGARISAAVVDFIAGEFPSKGDRHRVLYGYARNLGEAGVPLQAAIDLLMPSARDCGLTTDDAARQIRCGIADATGVPDATVTDGQEVA